MSISSSNIFSSLEEELQSLFEAFWIEIKEDI
jgi:hypothetical protein